MATLDKEKQQRKRKYHHIFDEKESDKDKQQRKRKHHNYDEKELILDIMEEYWRVRKDYERTVANQGFKAFEQSRESVPQLLQIPMTPLNIPEYTQVKEKQSTSLRRGDTNSIVNKCPVIPIEYVESAPPMQYWTHTEANVIAEDEYTLSHIPFLGDSVDDTSFCMDLMKTFPEGIHGTKEGCGEYINDYILYYMVKAVKGLYPEIDLKIIFKHVYHRFPNKASRHELFAMYPDLQQRFEPDTLIRTEFTNEEGELMANFCSSRLLNSYEVLFCHKCFAFDCIMHNATVADNYGGGRRIRKRTDRSRAGKEKDNDAIRACSANCFMKVDKIKSPPPTTSHKGYYQNLLIDINGQHANIWTPHEESIFAVLRRTGEDNFCEITKMLNMCTAAKNKKTCREVYEYASRTGPLSPRLDLPSSPVKNAKCRKNRDSHRTFRAMKWANTNGKVENGGMFKPCKHKGECREENSECYCSRVNNLCTKYCGCSEECKNRFPGCRCAPGNCRTKQCQCYYASWECDPDICKSCNCDKMETNGEPICKNVSIQRGLQKRLIVAPSQVAGWGCFANEDIEKNDFISEYCGEVISQAESERRGKIYDRIKCSYLFALNDEQVVDATRVGNVIRFANHSKNPNCRARVIVVNGDHKIGIFAQRQIKCGEELFFDYAYNKSQQVQFVPKELSSIIKQREKTERTGIGGVVGAVGNGNSQQQSTSGVRGNSI